MSSDIIQADYVELERISARFLINAEGIDNLRGLMHSNVQNLTQGDWKGRGSHAFLAEMEHDIFPSIQRLIHALKQAQIVTLDIIQTVRQAEEEAADLFKVHSEETGIGKTQNGASVAAHNARPTIPPGPGGYTLPENPNEITEEYWESLTPEQQKYLHHNRNYYQDSAGIPEFERDLVDGQWDDKGEAIAHNLGDGVSGNKDYRGVGARANQQAIYDANGRLVKTPENRGTYDFISPNQSLWGHFQTDVLPWIKWGNSPDDTTTREQRIAALMSGFFGG